MHYILTCVYICIRFKQYQIYLKLAVVPKYCVILLLQALDFHVIINVRRGVALDIIAVPTVKISNTLFQISIYTGCIFYYVSLWILLSSPVHGH